MSDVVMPRLSDSMEEGTIIRWLRSDGDEVSRGDELVEIETDKATMTYEADRDGVLQVVASEGDTLAIGELIARIGAAGEGADGGEDSGRQSPVASRHDSEQPDGEDDEEPTEERRTEAPPPDGDGGERVKASPVARRVARERGVDLDSLSGSGPGGRIVKADVESAAGGGREAAEPAPAADGGDRAAGGKGDVQTQELTRIQQTIARRMAESRATVPDFTLRTQVEMEAAVAAREQMKAVSGDRPAPSLNDMVVKACGLALREFPRANGSYRDGRFELHSRVNVGVAVAGQDSLVVPTVFDVDRKSLGRIAAETRELARKVREGQIAPPEVSGGTFTVSNLGMYGIESFAAVINPPQAAILSVGSVEPRAVVRDGEVTARHTMSLTLGCDHRILYGAPAAEFLARVRELLENPSALAL